MSEDIDLGARLFELRDEREWPQRVLEEISGVSHTTIAGIETGRIRNPRSATLRRLARAFDMSLEEFTGKAPAPPSTPEAVEAPEEARREQLGWWRLYTEARLQRWDERIEEARDTRRAPYEGWTDDLKLAVEGLASKIEREGVLDVLAQDMNAIEASEHVSQETMHAALDFYQALARLTQVFPRALEATREVHREQRKITDAGAVDMLSRLSQKREALGRAS